MRRPVWFARAGGADARANSEQQREREQQPTATPKPIPRARLPSGPPHPERWNILRAPLRRETDHQAAKHTACVPHGRSRRGGSGPTAASGTTPGKQQRKRGRGWGSGDKPFPSQPAGTKPWLHLGQSGRRPQATGDPEGSLYAPLALGETKERPRTRPCRLLALVTPRPPLKVDLTTLRAPPIIAAVSPFPLSSGASLRRGTETSPLVAPLLVLVALP